MVKETKKVYNRFTSFVEPLLIAIIVSALAVSGAVLAGFITNVKTELLGYALMVLAFGYLLKQLNKGK